MSWLQTLRQSWRDAHPAVLTDQEHLSFADLDARISRAAGWLAREGLRPGDVVALQMPRSVDFLVLHLAALGTGIVTLPLNTGYTARELEFYLADSKARLAIVLPDQVDALEPGPARILPADDALTRALAAAEPAVLPEHLPPETVAVLLYTSGTTGRPKGAVLRHGNIAATVEGLHEAWRWSDDDVLLHALPLFHVHGLFVAQHGALRAGATTHWMPRFDAEEVLRRIAEDGITVFMGVPTFYARLLSLPEQVAVDVTGMRLFTSGSAPLPARDHARFHARFGQSIVERYGMTEVGIVLTNPYDGPRRPGTVGHPVPGARARVVDPTTGEPVPDGTVGEIRIAGPSVFDGYLGLPEKTAEALVDGWMCTGDLGMVDDHGYFRIVGRSKDMVISGGLNVYPSEVEAVLLEHPDVAEAAVVGVPHPDLGERVVASVVPARGTSPDPLALIATCRAHLAPYKCPKAIELVESLPRNAMGKVRKEVLRATWSAVRCQRAGLDAAERLSAWNVAMALETEGIALDRDTAMKGAVAAINGEAGAWYVQAFVAGEVVGQCMITPEWSDWRNRRVWWFQSVYVPPAWRGRGIFRALYEHVVKEAREAGAGGLRLYVDRRNTRAQQVYRALGMDGSHYAVYEAMFDEPPPAERLEDRPGPPTLRPTEVP